PPISDPKIRDRLCGFPPPPPFWGPPPLKRGGQKKNNPSARARAFDGGFLFVRFYGGVVGLKIFVGGVPLEVVQGGRGRRRPTACWPWRSRRSAGRRPRSRG